MLGAITLLMLIPFYTIYKIISIDDHEASDKQFILISDVIKELNNKNISVENLKYIDDFYGQYKSKYIDYPFRKLQIEDFTNTKFCEKDSLLICSIIPYRIKFCNISIKRSHYTYMLKQLGVRI